jgi:hypothetical protein
VCRLYSSYRKTLTAIPTHPPTHQLTSLLACPCVHTCIRAPIITFTRTCVRAYMQKHALGAVTPDRIERQRECSPRPAFPLGLLFFSVEVRRDSHERRNAAKDAPSNRAVHVHKRVCECKTSACRNAWMRMCPKQACTLLTRTSLIFSDLKKQSFTCWTRSALRRRTLPHTTSLHYSDYMCASDM